MSINNIGSNIPIQVDTFGGTGNATLSQYGVLYGNNTSPIGVTSVGTSGQILTSHGGVSAPTFENGLTSLGDFIFIGQGDLNFPAPNGLAFTTGFSANYTNYMIMMQTFGPLQSSPSGCIGVQLSIDGGATWLSDASNTYYNSYLNSFNSSDSTWRYSVQIGCMAMYPFSPSASRGISHAILGHMNKPGRPFLIGQATPTQTIPYFMNAFYKVGDITANAFRIVGVGYQNGSVTVRAYRMRTN